MKERVLSFATLTYKEPIIFIKYRDNVRLDVKEIHEMMAACDSLSGNKPYLVLANITNFVDITPEGNKASVDKKITGNIIASAPLVKKLGQRLMSNVFLEVNRPPYPMRVFNDEKKAIKWLLEQHKKAIGAKPRKANNAVSA
jgi:hypothetical protein